jgi:4-hydroxy-tetrahydrodipicolinate reductase
MSKARVVSYGLGPIGRKALELAAQKECLEIVGAIDIDPELIDQDLGELARNSKLSGRKITNDAAALFAATRPDIVIHCTSSFLPVVEEQLISIASSGVNIISSTEELLWPRLQHPERADRIDGAAREAGVTVLGTGVNPGFVMDTLPAFASAVCLDVQKIVCRRVVDATSRRLPFQKKIGAGLSTTEFKQMVAAGKLGHIGLRESIALLGGALGFELDDIRQTIDPIVADSDLQTPFLKVRAGQVAGIWNRGHGSAKGTLKVEMDLRMYVGAEDPLDEAILDANPPIHVRILGGTHGDLATAAMLVNGIPGVLQARPGLLTMLDVPVPHLVR